MGHPLLHHFDAGLSFHFGSQNNVAGMLHYIVPFLFGTAIPTSLNHFFVIGFILVYINICGELSVLQDVNIL